MSGDNGIGSAGIYGAQGIASASNTPGSRVDVMGWGSQDAFWLFGGEGMPSTNPPGRLNDLWKLDACTTSAVSLTKTACSSYVGPGGQVWTTSGTYKDTLTNAFGCDSFITISLTVIPLTAGISQNGTTLAASPATGVLYQWIDCSNNALVAGASSAVFTPTTTGSYAVMIGNSSCVDTSDCVSVAITAISPLMESSLIVVCPNPSLGVFYLSAPCHATVRDALGNTPQTHFLAEALDPTPLPAGIYLLPLRTVSGAVQHTRIVLQY